MQDNTFCTEEFNSITDISFTKEIQKTKIKANNLRQKFNESLLSFLTTEQQQFNVTSKIDNEESVLFDMKSLNDEIVGYEFSKLLESSEIYKENEKENINFDINEGMLEDKKNGCIENLTSKNINGTMERLNPPVVTSNDEVLTPVKDVLKENLISSNNSSCTCQASKDLKFLQEQFQLEKINQQSNQPLKHQINIAQKLSSEKQITNLKDKIRHLSEELKLSKMKRELVEERLNRRVCELVKRNEELEAMVMKLKCGSGDKGKEYNGKDKKGFSRNCDRKEMLSSFPSFPTTQKPSHSSKHMTSDPLYNNNPYERIKSSSKITSSLDLPPNKPTNIRSSSSILTQSLTLSQNQSQTPSPKIITFPNQTQKHYPNHIEIYYSNGSIRYISSKVDEVIFKDGTISRICNGIKVIDYPTGEREVYWNDMKQRFECDGSVRTVYSDGTKEIVYPNGVKKVMNGSILSSFKSSLKET